MRMFSFTLILCLMLSSLFACEKEKKLAFTRADEARQIAKELDPKSLTKEELEKRVQSREKHLQKSLDSSLGAQKKKAPANTWHGPKKWKGKKAWNGPTTKEN